MIYHFTCQYGVGIKASNNPITGLEGSRRLRLPDFKILLIGT
jgi:hypothetical protein